MLFPKYSQPLISGHSQTLVSCHIIKSRGFKFQNITLRIRERKTILRNKPGINGEGASLPKICNKKLVRATNGRIPALEPDTNGGLSRKSVPLSSNNVLLPFLYNSRKVVEHIFLLKAKRDLSEEKEKDMLDFLYTSQYHMNGIVAISLGRIINPNADNCTHAVFMRFQRREGLEEYYENPFHLRVLAEYVMPYCHGYINLDYEFEVEDDILPIFRKGEDFESGVEFLLMISVLGTAVGQAVEEALAALLSLTNNFGSLIIQATLGSNFNLNDRDYTHGAVMRFPSLDALEKFTSSFEYKDIWRQKFQPITGKALVVYYAVDPIGTQIMFEFKRGVDAQNLVLKCFCRKIK
ncbi:stress-response A/B barrel domain-containing protein UP3 isoform X3 [Amborella trichopoda]|uniref:stress-response A/B barrel domain-containing protein UP3 isoform X3 n=1 Tax=Amborella trichopoda TaxID=13333 RepID=UPI0009BF1205|nr:stress-response A/B barrel domain-containing protein UP3 isoform X3 [Amborella trichopoda]|eukprot:XP_020527693.1 stress-response A/B barrel domain-containing protein UP3 isoform X3 [Amborella trichopoda]